MFGFEKKPDSSPFLGILLAMLIWGLIVLGIRELLYRIF